MTAPYWSDVHSLRHGFNLADVDRLARFALSRVRFGRVDAHTRYETAWHVIVESLYAAPEDAPPTPSDLVYAGQNAVMNLISDEMRHHGRSTHNPGETRPGFVRYWDAIGRPSRSPEGRIVERHALWQIWPTLTPSQRKALLALAVHGDYKQAAAAIGMTYATFLVNVSTGRRRFLRWWHEGEKPSRTWGRDIRVGKASYRAARKAMIRRPVGAS